MDLDLPPLGLNSTETPQEISSNFPSEQEPLPTLGNEFLRAIPQQDRDIVAKYISDWDSNVTKRFQSIHDQYQPYKELGPIEEIQYAMQVNSALRSDPVMFLTNLQKAIEELRAEGFLEDMSDMNDPGQAPVNQEPNVLPEYGNLPPEFVEKFTKMEQMLEKMGSTFEQQMTAAQEAEEMRQLDEFMQELHNEHGDFDDEYVLLQLSKGKTPEQALKAWSDLQEKVVGSRPRNTAPRMLGGSGNIPGGQVDPSKLSAEDRIKFIAGSLSQGG